eukprot:6466677-Amphidinium_carterae.4
MFPTRRGARSLEATIPNVCKVLIQVWMQRLNLFPPGNRFKKAVPTETIYQGAIAKVGIEPSRASVIGRIALKIGRSRLRARR